MAKTKAETTTLDRALRGTLVGIWAERLARAFWPFLSIALLLWAVLAFGVQTLLSGGWSTAFGLGALALLLAAFCLGGVAP